MLFRSAGFRCAKLGFPAGVGKKKYCNHQPVKLADQLGNAGQAGHAGQPGCLSWSCWSCWLAKPYVQINQLELAVFFFSREVMKA